jgi:hypothetical protein
VAFCDQNLSQGDTPSELFYCNGISDVICMKIRLLARIIHEGFTAAADPGMPAALRSVGFLDVLSSTPAESSRRAPCIHARLRRLATNLHE